MANAPEVVQWEFEKGAITFRGHRMCLMDTTFFSGLKQEMADMMGIGGAKAVLRSVARRGGQETATVLSGDYGHLNTFAKMLEQAPAILNNIFPLYGWGIGEITVDSEKQELVLKLRHSYEAQGLSAEFSTPSCYLLEGYMEGIISGLLTEDIEFRETKCVTLGDDCCEFTCHTA
ncbi:MAG: V4R domain-containing protein [Chloroflexota bacterium]|nr:V4R domain-containing protein [Chloroflexota bacterium]